MAREEFVAFANGLGLWRKVTSVFAEVVSHASDLRFGEYSWSGIWLFGAGYRRWLLHLRFGFGMITVQHTQESLSRAFVHAVAGCAGVNCEMTRAFDYGVDGTFRPVVVRDSRRIENGFPLDFQLKCTQNWSVEGEDISYQVKAKTYNDLVTRQPEEIGVILVLLCVPKEQKDWASFAEDKMLIRNCCYYSVLSGAPLENEKSSKKILIPRKNVLNAESLNELLAAEKRRKILKAA